MSVLYLILIILAAAGLVVLVLWYALTVGWSFVLGRMASSVSTWEEIEQDPR